MSKRPKRDRPRPDVPRRLEAHELLQFWEAGVFGAAWRDLKLDTDDLLDLQMEIILRPTAAPVVPGTDGLRKLRFSPRRWSKGKRGSVRVGYVHFDDYRVVLLIVAYAKNEQDDLSSAGRKAIRNLIDRERKALEKGRTR